ncbi:MAG: thiamine pyrophosphate-binding protein [Pseudomonadota bacterium]
MNDVVTARAADHLARRLFEAGCRRAFGMPGGEVLTIVDALEKAGIRFILCKHENNAGFMAEGAHHRDGAPALLVATVGPGVANGINVVANAQQDRVPMIVLSGCVDADEAQTYTHQVFDHAQVLRSITKESFRLSAASADIIADKAVNIALEGRAGPVHIDVPISVADQEVTLRPRRRAATARAVPAAGPDLDRARRWLGDARRPVMIAGLDAVAEEAANEIASFCDRFGVPLITTYKAKGLLQEKHPLSLGGAGLSPKNDRVLLPFVQSADLIICAGYDPIEMRPGWREIWDPATHNVIDITPEPNTHYMHQAGVAFVAGTGETLAVLGKDVEARATWENGEVAATKAALLEAFPNNCDWGPSGIIDECRKVLPQETLATADSGAHRILLSQMWEVSEPRGLIQSSALCTMGCAVPMAIGLALAEPHRPVISFSGDAGMLMVTGELSTAAELGVRPIFLVFVDASLALIELKQRQRQLRNAGVDFGQHDFAAIGRAFGGQGATVQNRAELRAALQEAQSSDRFTVIAAVIEPHAYDGLI